MKVRLGGLLCIAFFCLQVAAAENYPTRPIRFIVPAGAGAAADINARLLAFELVKQLGQQVVVDNRPGAAGSIGTELIVRAVPDGHTIGYGMPATLAINPSMFARLPYDPQKDLLKIVQLGTQPQVLVVTASLPVRSVQELIAHARSNAGKLSYGSNGNGATPHLSMELFKYMTATHMVHVPYKAMPAAIAEMIAGHVQLLFDPLSSILPHIKANKVRPLGVSSANRSAALPELPTIAEAGVPGYEATTWGGIVAPAGLSKAIVTKLNAEVNKALVAPTLTEKYAASSYQVVGGTPDQFDVFVRREAVKWAEVIKRSGARIE